MKHPTCDRCGGFACHDAPVERETFVGATRVLFVSAVCAQAMRAWNATQGDG